MATGRARASSTAGATYAMLSFASVAWGGSFIAARMVLSAPAGNVSLTPTLLAALRFLIASLFFAPALYWQHTRVERVNLRDLPLFFLLGQLAFSVYFYLQYTGVRLTNASISSVLVVGGIPLATMLVSRLFLGERLYARQLLSVLIGFSGVVIVAVQKGISFSLREGFFFGALCLLANALCFGVYSSLVRKIRNRYRPFTITACTMLAGTITLVVASAFTEDLSTLTRLTGAQWLAVLYLSVVCSILAYLAYNTALNAVPAGRASVFIYLESPVAILLGFAILGEGVSPMTLVGSFAILLCLYLSHRA